MALNVNQRELWIKKGIFALFFFFSLAFCPLGWFSIQSALAVPSPCNNNNICEPGLGEFCAAIPNEADTCPDCFDTSEDVPPTNCTVVNNCNPSLACASDFNCNDCNPCTVALCKLPTGACQSGPKSCNNTTPDRCCPAGCDQNTDVDCVGAAGGGGGKPGSPCSTDQECNDNNFCTIDSCQGGTCSSVIDGSLPGCSGVMAGARGQGGTLGCQFLGSGNPTALASVLLGLFSLLVFRLGKKN